MKKVVRTICIVLCVGLILGLGYIVLRKMKKYPEEIEYSALRAFTDNGMYYARRNMLYFLDSATGESVVVCNKANCKHNTTKCNAYTIDVQPAMLCYGDKIYISEFDSELTFNDDGDAVQKGVAQIREINKDGSGARVLYSADEGAVIGMEMVDGVLYFTTWKYHDGFKLNEYQHDCTLYAYDLRWNRLRTLLSYEGDAEHDNAALYILNNKNKEKLYLTYGYEDSKENRHTILFTYNIKTHADEIIEDDLNTKYGRNFDIISTSSGNYIKTTELDNDVEWSVIYSCDENIQNQKEIFRFVGGSVDCMDGYLYAISTDYNKFFYQCDTGTIYLANTCFTGEGTYISDIYGLDESSDKIYIDGHDYTGMKPGDVITSDQSEQTVTGWAEFRDTYFTKLEDADQSVVKTFDWVKWPEE